MTLYRAMFQLKRDEKWGNCEMDLTLKNEVIESQKL